MSFQQFLLVLRARYRIVLLTLLQVVAVTLVLSLVLPKKYSATAAVFVDVKSPDPVAGMMMPAMAMPGYMATQVDIVTSDRVGQKVVKLLRLDQNPTIRQQWKDETHGKGKLEVWLGELLQKKLEVKPARESSIINITYKAADPAFAATLANAFAQAYIDTNIELKVEPARQYSQWFKEQGKTMRENLEKAQTAISEYHQKTGIVASDERLDNETAKLSELSTQLTAVQAQTADAGSKQRSGGASSTLPEVMQNPMILSLKSDISRLDAKLNEASGNLGKNHPQYLRMQSELASLKQKLETEMKQITSGFGATRSVGKDKEAELKAAIEAQKQKLLDIKRERDALAVLMRDVDTAQKAYDSVSQRQNQTNLESLSTQTNLSILTPAYEPLEPSSPRIVFNLLLSIFVGTLLGVGVALGREVLDQRVRSPDDLAESLQLPMLGLIQKPASAKDSRFMDLGRRAFWQRRPAPVAG